MPNANYVKGCRKERAIVNAARETGCIAFRSAGSHSPIDVVIIDVMAKTVCFVQCKPADFSEKKKKELEEAYKSLNSSYHCSFHVK